MSNLSNKILTILVFDEDPVAARKIILWLRLIGHTVHSCSVYDDFLDQLTIHEYDAVLFDFNDSNSNEFNSLHGIKFYRFTAVIKPALSPKFILYTNKTDHSQHYSHSEDMENAGIDGILSKSLSSEQFFNQLASSLNLPTFLAKNWEKMLTDKAKYVTNVVQLHPTKIST